MNIKKEICFYLCVATIFVFITPGIVLGEYVVVNEDGSIHTISEKNDDVLQKGQSRFIANVPKSIKEQTVFYRFKNGRFEKKDDEEINRIKTEYNDIITKNKAMTYLALLEKYRKLRDLGYEFDTEIEYVESKLRKLSR